MMPPLNKKNNIQKPEITQTANKDNEFSQIKGKMSSSTNKDFSLDPLEGLAKE